MCKPRARALDRHAGHPALAARWRARLAAGYVAGSAGGAEPGGICRRAARTLPGGAAAGARPRRVLSRPRRRGSSASLAIGLLELAARLSAGPGAVGAQRALGWAATPQPGVRRADDDVGGRAAGVRAGWPAGLLWREA